MAKTDMPEVTPVLDPFGERQLHISLSSDGASYEVDPEELQNIEEMGVTESFPVLSLSTMQARCCAFGYVLIIE